MFDPNIQFDRRYAFYFDREGNTHPIDACYLDRLQASKCEVDQLEANDYAAPTPTQAKILANLDEHFGTLTEEPAAVLSDSTDPAAYSPVHPPSSTHWTPSPATYRRLVAALRRQRRPSWLTQPASRTAA